MFDEILNSFDAADNALGQEIEQNRLRVIDITFKDVSVTGGTVGTRALQKTYDMDLVREDDEKIYGVVLARFEGGNTTDVNMTTFSRDNSVFLNIYRASSSAVTFNSITIRVILGKISNTLEITS